MVPKWHQRAIYPLTAVELHQFLDEARKISPYWADFFSMRPLRWNFTPTKSGKDRFVKSLSPPSKQ